MITYTFKRAGLWYLAMEHAASGAEISVKMLPGETINKGTRRLQAHADRLDEIVSGNLRRLALQAAQKGAYAPP